MYDAIANEQAAITNRAINVWSCAKSVIKLVTEIRHRGVFFFLPKTQFNSIHGISVVE